MNARNDSYSNARSLQSYTVVAPLAVPVTTGTLAPVPELGFLLQLAALGGALGGLVAARARRRNTQADAAAITSAWAGLGLVVGLALMLVASIV